MKPKLVAKLQLFYVHYKQVVTDEKYYILFAHKPILKMSQ
jgi:hypothetical protein